MPPRKSKDKEVQPAQVEHADDNPVYSEGENDPFVPPFLSPFVERSYGNPIFKEKDADRRDDFAESSNVFRGMIERLDLAFKEQNQAMRRLVDSQAESSRHQEELIRQCIEEMRRVFEEGTRVMRETEEKSRRTLQAVSEQVVEQVRQPRLEILPPVVEMPKQIQEAPIPALGGQGNQPHPNIQQQNFFIGEGQRQNELMEAATPIADHGHQPQYRDHGPALRPLEKIDKGILKFPDKAKEAMGVDADPFPAVSVGVNIADLKSVAKNHNLPHAQRNLAAEDLRWVLEARRSRHSRSVRLQRKRVEERKRQQKLVEAEGSSSRRPRQPTKRNMVWVRKEKNETVTQTLSKGDGQSPASPKVASVIVSPDGVLKATFEAQEQSGNRGAESKGDGTIHFGEFSVNLLCLVLTLPLVFQAKKEEEPIVCEFLEQMKEEVIVVPAQDDEEEDMANKIVFEKPKEKMAIHIRPLYINAHIDGTPISHVLVDNGAAVIVLPTCMLYKIGKSLDDLVHIEAEVVSADDKPFLANTHLVEARYYEEDIGTIRFFGMYRHGKPIGIIACSRLSLSKRVVEKQARLRQEKQKAVLEITKKLAAYFVEKAVQVDRSEIVHEGKKEDQGDEVTLEELDLAPAKLDDLKAEVQDSLEEINLGSKSEPRVTFISGSLEPQTRDEIVRLLHEFKDYFAWDYLEMPSLDQKLVEHKLPIVEGFRPYADWLSNVMPVLKKNGKLRVCVDFRNLNLATPKDEYPMPIADLLIDGVAHHKILSFMDGHSGYNQIFIADTDVPKIAFRCPGAVGTFEWVVMPFGLKNAGATYQRAMNAIFYDMIGKFMEIYIDDVVVKSHGEADHLVHLRKAFKRMRQHGLKMNPLKCAFGVSASNFLGYLVHECGLEVDKNKAKAVIEAKPPQNKKELQRFLGQVNFLRRFISNLAGKTRVFSLLLKLKSEADFKWEEHHQSAFDMIKRYLSRPPVLVPPMKNKPLILYISAADESIGCLLAQENDKKQEQAVYYLSRCLTQTEVKYSSVEKLCLALFFAAIKLRHYLIYSEVYVVAKTDIVKYMLSRPLLIGRIGKWILALSEFNLKYIPQKAVKGQALADFLADHLCLDVEADEEKGINLFSISLVPWKLIFDGSSIETMSGVGVVVISPSGLKTQMSFQLDFDCTNNQVEYEALIIGLEILVELKVSMVEVIGDSQLVLKQLSSEYKCTSLALTPYFALAVQLLEEFDDVSIRHLPRDQNYEANEMVQIASGLRIPEGPDESFQMLSDVHDGICGAHQAGIKMRWLIRRHGFFWPSILKDCIAYAKGCKSCQIHGPLQRVPASLLNSIVKPWPFRSWAVDLIGKVYPSS
ncbi:hypothetical protein SLEP1_g56600 [Rubroshorea leprosula]|uniref:RNase H type-1 domain-containing protein n=1 Tax=Rubroshorea leprosula TaxID=152421 RepID=A0AAV5MK40_9ROSI|nr:hypothetical protein SLEP1_g56600 [Rubroshorea leprosula]